jgi:hypothetical protein
MKRSNHLPLLAVVALFGLSITLFLFDRTADAQRDATVRWEYAAITGAFPTLTNDNPTTTATASANICYLQATGCVNEEIKADLTYSKFFQDMKLDNNATSRELAQAKVVEIAVSKAFSKLGSDGWELISTPGNQFMTFLPNAGGGYDLHEGSANRPADIYFKRQRR